MVQRLATYQIRDVTFVQAIRELGKVMRPIDAIRKLLGMPLFTLNACYAL